MYLHRYNSDLNVFSGIAPSERALKNYKKVQSCLHDRKISRTPAQRMSVDNSLPGEDICVDGNVGYGTIHSLSPFVKCDVR